MLKLPLTIVFSLLLSVTFYAQSNVDWIRVQTDDGKFSIEVPSEHKYFFSRDGFIVSRHESDYLTSNMSMVTAFSERTLLSVEVYDAVPAALWAILDKDTNTEWTDEADERIGNARVKVIRRKGDDAFARSKYFVHDGKIFILLAASRNGKNDTIERFFSSVDLKSKDAAVRTGTALSKLKRSDVTMKETEPSPSAARNTAVASTKSTADPTAKKFVLLRRFASSYVPKARNESVSGNIKLRVYFAQDGFIPHLDVYEKLGGGLLRQTLYAAARMRYLPEEREGKPVTISRPVSYSFRIY